MKGKHSSKNALTNYWITTIQFAAVPGSQVQYNRKKNSFL